MKKTLFTTLLFLAFTLANYAGNSKTTSFKGQVTDEKGNPVIGAKVMIKGSKSSVYTDFDGVFVFNSIANTKQTVKVSMISFKEKESIVNLKTLHEGNTYNITIESKKL